MDLQKETEIATHGKNLLTVQSSLLHTRVKEDSYFLSSSVQMSSFKKAIITVTVRT